MTLLQFYKAMSQYKTSQILIKGNAYSVNVEELKGFFAHCQNFMDTDPQQLEIMTQVIADSLLENAHPTSTVDEIKPQILFLREIGMLLKSILSPIDEPPVDEVSELR